MDLALPPWEAPERRSRSRTPVRPALGLLGTGPIGWREGEQIQRIEHP